MTLGHDKFHTRWPREISADYLEKHGKKIGAVHSLRGVQQAVTRALPLLSEWPDLPLSCFDLMYIESEAIIRTMLRLLREQGVVCLSVHDSIIAPLLEREGAMRILRDEYRRAAGVEPTLTIHLPSAEVQEVITAA
jgi:hypothetical protein